jgi:beta-RFAP synthase
MGDLSITISAPSRLHFGLLSFNNKECPQFGGVGLMLERPGIDISVVPAGTFRCTGTHRDRVQEFAQSWQAYHRLSKLPACHITVHKAPPQHVGLGVGTQLGISIAAGLTRYEFGRCDSAADLAASVDRGKRSAIGTHGFESGGFLFELGKSDEREISELAVRRALPDDWRVVLIRPNEALGLSGTTEQTAFDELPPVPKSITKRLIAEVTESMIPAIESKRFNDFAASVTRYGETAGRCFESCQGGPYASPRLQSIVDFLLRCGVTGVGQSSWGPTLFALQPSEQAANELVTVMQDSPEIVSSDLVISRIANAGAKIEIKP